MGSSATHQEAGKPPEAGGRSILRDMAMTAGPKIAGGVLMVLLNLALVFVWPPPLMGAWAFWLTLVLLADAVIGSPIDLAVVRLAQARLDDEPAAALAGQAALNSGAPGLANPPIAHPPAADPVAVERTALALRLFALVPAGGLALLAAALGGEAMAAGGAALAAAATAMLGGLLVLRAMLTHLQMRRRFAVYGAVESFHVALRLGLVGLAILGFGAGPAGVLLMLALAAGASGLLAGLLARQSFGSGSASAGMSRDRRLALGELLRLLRWYTPSIALGATIGRLDVLMLGLIAGATQLGLYGAALGVAQAPELIGAYLGIALSPYLVAQAQQGAARGLMLRLHGALLALAFIGFAAMAMALASPLANLLPPAYAGTGPLLLLLLAGTLAGMVTTPLALPLVLLARRDFLLKVDCIAAPLAAMAYLLAIPAHGAIGAAMVAATTHLVRSGAVHLMAWRLAGRPHDLRRA